MFSNMNSDKENSLLTLPRKYLTDSTHQKIMVRKLVLQIIYRRERSSPIGCPKILNFKEIFAHQMTTLKNDILDDKTKFSVPA